MKIIPVCKVTIQFGGIVAFAALTGCGSPHFEDSTALANVDHSKEFFSKAPESSISENGRTAIRVDVSKNHVELYQRLSVNNNPDGELLPCYYRLGGEVSKLARVRVFLGVSEVDHIQFKRVETNFVWIRGLSDAEKGANRERCNDAAFAKEIVESITQISAIPVLDYSKDFLSVAPPDCLGVGLGGCTSLAELSKKTILLHAVDSSQLPFDPTVSLSIKEPSDP